MLSALTWQVLGKVIVWSTSELEHIGDDMIDRTRIYNNSSVLQWNSDLVNSSKIWNECLNMTNKSDKLPRVSTLTYSRLFGSDDMSLCDGRPHAPDLNKDRHLADNIFPNVEWKGYSNKNTLWTQWLSPSWQSKVNRNFSSWNLNTTQGWQFATENKFFARYFIFSHCLSRKSRVCFKIILRVIVQDENGVTALIKFRLLSVLEFRTIISFLRSRLRPFLMMIRLEK